MVVSVDPPYSQTAPDLPLALTAQDRHVEPSLHEDSEIPGCLVRFDLAFSDHEAILSCDAKQANRRRSGLLRGGTLARNSPGISEDRSMAYTYKRRHDYPAQRRRYVRCSSSTILPALLWTTLGASVTARMSSLSDRRPASDRRFQIPRSPSPHRLRVRTRGSGYPYAVLTRRHTSLRTPSRLVLSKHSRIT